jgi:hypothetical protein
MVLTNQVPVTNMTWDYVWGEVKELFIEIKRFNIKGILEELCDVYTCGMCALTRSTGKTFPIFWMTTVNKYYKRVDFFKWYFSEIGLEYKLKYLRNGANYNKEWKRRKAVELAIEDQLK